VPYRNNPLIDQGHALLAEAQAAASRGDPHGMIAAQTRSHFMDGLVGRLTAQWGRQLGQAEIRDVVAQAVDKAFDAISQGKPIGNLGGWLWKATSSAQSNTKRALSSVEKCRCAETTIALRPPDWGALTCIR
jgi:hypothetical protein